MRFSIIRLCLCAAAACAVRPATAQQTAPADEGTLLVEIYAPRLPNPAERLPADITVLDRSAMDGSAASTLEEALGGLSGIDVVRNGGPGSQTSVFIRGTESDHTLVLFNGLPVNDPGAPGGAYTFGNDLLAAIDRVEVIRGPASSYYGSGALGGVVNLENRPGGDMPFEGFVDVAGGHFSTWRGAAGGRGSVGRLDYVASVAGLTTAGDNASPERIATNRGEDDGADIRNATVAADIDLKGARLDLAARWRRTTVEIDDIPNDDPNYTGSTDHYAWVAGIERDLFGNRATLRLQAGESDYERGFENKADSNSVKVQNDLFESHRRHGEAAGTWRFGQRATLIAGGSLSDDRIATRTSLDSGSGPFRQTAEVSERDAALFVSGDIRATRMLDLSAGLRHELPEVYPETTTWRAGAVLRLDAWRAKLHATVGTAFKAPTLYDRFGTTNLGFKGNPNLKPEEARTVEVGIAGDRRLFGHSNGAAGRATLFVTDIENLIETDFTLNTTVNRDTARARGLELALTLRPASWALVKAHYTYTLVEERGNGASLSRRPRHKGSVSAQMQPADGWTVTPKVSFVGSRADVTYADSNSFIGRAQVGGYPLVSLDIRYRLNPGVSLYAEGRNLMDRDYEPLNGVAGPGASVLAGIRVRF